MHFDAFSALLNMAKIYTRTGDEGTTGTYAGKRVPKNHEIIIAGGKIDGLLAELDGALMELKELKSAELTTEKKAELAGQLEWVEKKLWQTGGEVSLGKPGKNALDCVNAQDVKQLEDWVDGFNLENNFFIRFTTRASVAANKARVACREAEVALVPLLRVDLRKEGLRREVFVFMNRLSDYLYALACALEKNQVVEQTQSSALNKTGVK